MSTLPSGWTQVELGEIGTLRYGKGLPTNRLLPEGYPVFGANGIIGCYNQYHYEDEQILISCRGANSGTINTSPKRCFVTNNSLVFDLEDVLRPGKCFLTYALMNCDKSRMITGTAQPQVTIANAETLRLLLPPLSEQIRISSKLDSLRQKSQSARTEIDRIPTLIEKFKQAIRNHVFGKSGWPTKRFFTVLDFKGGSQPPKSTFSTLAGSGLVRLLQIRDFSSDEKAIFIRDHMRWAKCTSNDIMVGRYGASVGKVLTGKAGAYNVALVKMLIDPAIFEKRFIYYWLQTDDFQSAVLGVSRSAQNGFNKSDLENVSVPVPSILQQKAALREIEKSYLWVDRIASETNAARALVARLDAVVLAKACEGSLVPQDPNDESVAQLLKRILVRRIDRYGAKVGMKGQKPKPKRRA
jgi:type I restriction enzyme S subunit